MLKYHNNIELPITEFTDLCPDIKRAVLDLLILELLRR